MFYMKFTVCVSMYMYTQARATLHVQSENRFVELVLNLPRESQRSNSGHQALGSELSPEPFLPYFQGKRQSLTSKMYFVIMSEKT